MNIIHSNRWARILIDGGSLLIAVILDLVLNIVTLQTIGYDMATKTAMIALAAIIVLFGLRALVKGHNLLWFACAVLSVFFSLSFALLTTSTQSQAGGFEAGSDQELTRLTTKADQEAATLAQLRLDREAAIAKANRDSIDQSIIRQEPVAASAEKARTDRFNWIEQQRLAGATYIPPPLTANALFEAIPRTIGVPVDWLPPLVNWIKLAVFTLLFVIMQGTIVVSARESLTNKEHPDEEETPSAQPAPNPVQRDLRDQSAREEPDWSPAGAASDDLRAWFPMGDDHGNERSPENASTNAPQTPLPVMVVEDVAAEAAPAPVEPSVEAPTEEVEEVRPPAKARVEPESPGVQPSNPTPAENLRRFARIALEPWPYVMTPWELVELTGKPYERMNELHQHLVSLTGPGLEYLFEYDEEERKFRAAFNREIVDAALKGEK